LRTVHCQDKGLYCGFGNGYGSSQFGKNGKYRGGAFVGGSAKSNNINLSINYGTFYGGLIIDPSKLSNLFDFK
jgi:hypothetical protein